MSGIKGNFYVPFLGGWEAAMPPGYPAQKTVIDGPFAETKELIAGYWIWQVRSMEEAVEWLKRAPFGGGVEIEIRPVFEADDFGPALTPELRQQEERQRAQIEANTKR